MSDLKKQIGDDLEKKLRRDMAHAIKHYGEMATIAELDAREMMLVTMSALVRLTTAMALQLEMPKSLLHRAINEVWAIEAEDEQ